jgi:hypothetical protein
MILFRGLGAVRPALSQAQTLQNTHNRFRVLCIAILSKAHAVDGLDVMSTSNNIAIARGQSTNMHQLVLSSPEHIVKSTLWHLILIRSLDLDSIVI